MFYVSIGWRKCFAIFFKNLYCFIVINLFILKSKLQLLFLMFIAKMFQRFQVVCFLLLYILNCIIKFAKLSEFYIQWGWGITGQRITGQSYPDWLKMMSSRTSKPGTCILRQLVFNKKRNLRQINLRQSF